MAIRTEVESLIREVARRHDSLLARKVAIITLVAAGGLSALVSLAWVLRGHSVPAWIPLSIGGASLAAGLVVWLCRRMDAAHAIRSADDTFHLKDAIASARFLAETRPEDTVTRLQWQWLQPRLKECHAETIRAPFPRRLAAAAAVLVALALWLGMLPPSPAVRAAEEEAIATRRSVEESKEQLEKLIEELKKETTDPEEKEVLKLDEFRKMVKEIDPSGNREEASRQFARIEQKMRDAAKSLEQRRDEETLNQAAKELAKAEQSEPRQIARKLDAKELKEAAEMLEKLAAKKLDPKDLKNAKTSEEKKQKLDEAKEQLARMRAVSKRMAAAGKQRQGARQTQQGKQQEGKESENGQEAEAGEMTEGKQGKALEDLMAELDEAAAKAEKNLEKMEAGEEGDEGEQGAMEKANGALGEMGRMMKGMHGKRMAMGKLEALRQGLAQAQGQMPGPGAGQMMAQSQSPGGKEAGTGSVESRRKETDDLHKNGQLSQLKGQHGQGPSMSSVEDADSGTGVSGRRGEAKQREFTRQMESFVQRDDVPESLKLGVRNYFESLQAEQPAPKPEN